MFKNAVEKINKFYNIDMAQNPHADEVFEVLSEIISFESAAIFYLSPNSLTLEFGKNFERFEDISIEDGLYSKIYKSNEDLSADFKQILDVESEIIIQRLLVKNTVFGVILLIRQDKFLNDERVIFKTCTSIISSLIKDMELSKVLKMQLQAFQSGIIQTNKTCESIKEQNKKIKENEKLQNEFIANVSHELRTPLNSIIGFSELLSNNLSGELNPKQSEYVEDIRVASIRLLGMINEVLDISKIESHTVKLNYSEVDLNLLIMEVCNILKPLCDKKGVKIVQNIEKDVIFCGDYIKFQQVIFNILGNAVKFSPVGEDVNLSVNTVADTIIIKIKDKGVGIEKKYHKKIFNKFFQVPNASSNKEASTGLGLAIAQEFVKLHHGTVEVNSEPDKGAEFIIKLPYHG